MKSVLNWLVKSIVCMTGAQITVAMYLISFVEVPKQHSAHEENPRSSLFRGFRTSFLRQNSSAPSVLPGGEARHYFSFK